MTKIGDLKLTWVLLTFLVLVSFPMSALATGTTLQATVNENEVGQGDNLTLTITLSSDSNTSGDEEPRLPTLDGFELLNKWTQSEASSIFDNGKFLFVRKQIYKYTLTPQRTGTLTIGSAQMRVNGQTLTTQPIKIKVVAGGGSGNSNVARNSSHRHGQAQNGDEDDQNNGNNPFGDDDDEDLFTQLLRRQGFLPDSNGGVHSRPKRDNHDAFFIAVEANKRKVYVGEEIVVSWYLYTRGAIQAFDALKYPDLKGFWKEDLEMASRLNFQQEVVDGVPYNKALLVSYAIFPLSPGKKTIDSYKAKATVIEMDSAMSMFGLGHPYSYNKSSQELPIEVVPLPTEGRPPSFSGAVGHFNVTGSLSATTVKVNQPVSLKIRFQGQGNVKAIELPPLNLPQSLEVYDTKKDSKFEKSGEGYQEFEVLLIPRQQGNVTIPPIAVSYFDPKTAKYVSQTTPSFNLKVLPGDGSAPDKFSAPLAQSEPDKVGNPHKDIRYLKTSPGLEVPPLAKKWGWVALFGMVYGWFGLQFWRVGSGRSMDQTALVKKRVRLKLKTAQTKMKAGDWRGVGVESSNAVLSTLGEVSGTGGGSLTSEEMLRRIPAATPELNGQIQKFLSRCEVVSFAPKEMAEAMSAGGGGEMQKLITEAEKIISALFELAKSGKSAEQANGRSEDPKTS